MYSMQQIGLSLVAVIAALHFYILYLEMFRWDSAGPRVFGMSREQVPHTRVLAANLGLYNGFLAAGLCWGLSQGDQGVQIQTFFLGCVAVAGVYAAKRVRKTLWVQTVPALMALGCVWWARI
jgi:putative membrane protein